MATLPPSPGVPRWVKVSVIVVGVLVVLLITLIIGGGADHGPGRHAPSGELDSHRWGLLILLCAFALFAAALNWSRLIDRAVPRPGSAAPPWPSRLNMTPRVRKFVLTAHVTFSVGSVGAVAVFLMLALVGLASQNAQTVRAAYVANGLIAWTIILPLIVTSLLIGLVQALGTPWGLLRHYWVLAKFMLTVATLYILLTQMDGISQVAGVAAETTLSDGELLGLRRSLRTHAAGGLVVLLTLVAISIYKPQGMTRYGWRKQQAERALSQS